LRRTLFIPMALALCFVACNTVPVLPSPIPTAASKAMLAATPVPTDALAKRADTTLTLGAPTNTTIKRLLGVNIGPAPAGDDPSNANLTKAYAQLNVNLVRTHDFYGPLDMAVMYPDRTRDPADPKSYDFAQSDEMWTTIVGAGCEPYLRLGDSWNNAKPPANAAERANWAKAAVQVVRHYRERSGWGVKYASVLRYVEIWNEPDQQQFWPKPRTPQEYFQLYEETTRALKQAFPDLIVGGPGISPAGALAPQGKKWTRDFLDYARQKNAPLDFFSWHMYSNDPNDWANAAKFYRGELDARGFKTTMMHVTEWNTAVKPEIMQSAEASALRTGGEGAAILTAAWIAMQDHGVEVSTFYRGPDPAMNAPTFYGLFYANGNPKQIAFAFLLWSKMADYPKRLSVTAAPNTSLWMLAGQADYGGIGLLIANPVDTPIRYSIAGAENFKTSVRQIGDARDPAQSPPPSLPLNEQIQSFTPTGNVIEIGAHTVQLVILTK